MADESTLSLGSVISAAIERRADAIAQLALRVDVKECPGNRVTGSETLLTRMIENVIDNAVKHDEPRGWVRVTTEIEGSLVRLVVDNGGPVLGQHDVDQLAQSFRRLGPVRTGSVGGTGLGLSIVESIAEVHGGTLDLHARSDGGLRVTISLPLAVATVTGARA